MALPARIQALIALIGHEKTMALVQAKGGDVLKIPVTQDSVHWDWLVETVGYVAAKQLIDTLGGAEPIYIAKCAVALRADRNRAIVARYDALIRAGTSSRKAISTLVRETSLANRQVQNIVNAPAPAPSGLERQRDLF